MIFICVFSNIPYIVIFLKMTLISFFITAPLGFFVCASLRFNLIRFNALTAHLSCCDTTHGVHGNPLSFCLRVYVLVFPWSVRQLPPCEYSENQICWRYDKNSWHGFLHNSHIVSYRKQCLMNSDEVHPDDYIRVIQMRPGEEILLAWSGNDCLAKPTCDWF